MAAAGCALGVHYPAYDPGATQSLRIPGGQHCLQLLDQLGVAYRRSPGGAGMRTPVEVQGPIAGVRYVGGGGAPLVCDCRLALALHWAGPVFTARGIAEIRHMGAYSNRTTRNGRPSMHASGLAIDVAGFRFPDRELQVVDEYVAGFGHDCAEDAPALNRLVCELRALGLFRELITPDHDSDHRDHVHLSILPL